MYPNFCTEESKRKRMVTRTIKDAVWAKQKGRCANPKCRNKLDPRCTEYDHKKGFAEGGPCTPENMQALCKNCHGLKTHKDRLKKQIKKIKRKNSEKDNSFGINLGSNSILKKPKMKTQTIDDMFGGTTANKRKKRKNQNPLDWSL